MNSVKALRSVNLAIVGLTCGLVPLAFYRGVLDTFDLTKATVLWLALLPLAATFLLGLRYRQWGEGGGLVLLSAGILAFALVLSVAFSMRPWISIFGQYQRNTGLLTWVASLLVMCGIAFFADESNERRLAGILTSSGIVVVAYVIVQQIGLDPWDWESPGQNKPLFSTLGNINSASGYMTAMVPLALLGFVEKRRRLFVVLSAGLAGAFSASLGLFQSFQGTVALVATVVLLLAHGLKQSSLLLFVNNVALCSLLLLASLYSTSGWRLFGFTVAALVCGLIHSEVSNGVATGLLNKLKSSKARLLACVSTLAGAAIVGAVLFNSRLTREVAGGFSERGDFYRTGIKVWSDHPLFGRGLETFGFVFPSYRPESHALRLEGNRTSSVHSLPLGLLVSGGVILFAAYLVLVVVTGRFGWKLLRHPNRTAFDMVIVSFWATTILQSLVSIEHVALILEQMVATGLVCSRYLRLGDPSKGAVSRSVRRPPWVWALLLPVVTGMYVMTNSFRADYHAFRAVSYFYGSQDYSIALREISRATDLAPWQYLHQYRKAITLSKLTDSEKTIEIATQAAKSANFNPATAVDLAYIVASVGDFSQAAEIMDRTVEADPFAQGVRGRASDLFTQMGDALRSSGNLNSARAFYEKALGVSPEYQPALDGLSALDG